MNDITKRLMDMDPSLELHNEGEWSDTQSLYSAFNDAGIECETGEFLYSLIRILKPHKVLETGTHWGIGSAYMGLALKDNGIGSMDTVEFIPEIFARAKMRIQKLEIDHIVKQHLMDVAKFEPNEKYQMILLDTEPQTRFAELIKFFPYLIEGGYIFIHDLHRHMHQIPNEEHGFAWPYGQVTPQMKELINTDQLRPFHIETPRGLTGFYKTHPEDYKWKSK